MLKEEGTTNKNKINYNKNNKNNNSILNLMTNTISATPRSPPQNLSLTTPAFNLPSSVFPSLALSPGGP